MTSVTVKSLARSWAAANSAAGPQAASPITTKVMEAHLFGQFISTYLFMILLQ
jgi:hypothetical protein